MGNITFAVGLSSILVAVTYGLQPYGGPTMGWTNPLVIGLIAGGLQFVLIIWLQGIWLPLHGYDYSATPLWAGIFMLPLTAGFLVAGPVSGTLSDRFGSRGLATAGALLFGASLLGLMVLPVNFSYWIFALLIALNGIATCSGRACRPALPPMWLPCRRSPRCSPPSWA